MSLQEKNEDLYEKTAEVVDELISRGYIDPQLRKQKINQYVEKHSDINSSVGTEDAATSPAPKQNNYTE